MRDNLSLALRYFKMGEKRSYKTYSKEFKEEAVALLHEQGYSVPEAAKELGIARNIRCYIILL